MSRLHCPRRPVYAAAVLCWLGCGAPQNPTPKPASKTEASAGAETPAAPYISPARWQYHPPPPEHADAFVRLENGGCAVIAEGGQRFLIVPTRKSARTTASPICEGEARAANMLAPEELTGLVKRSANAWIFTGASGTLYESNSVLGAFTRTVPAPEPLVRIEGAGSTLLGATLSGRLLRYSENEGWTPLEQAPPHIFDIAVAEGGRLLALGFPERLYASGDGGKSFRASPLHTMGAHRVGTLEGGLLGAQGLTESIAWDDRRTPAFAAAQEALLPKIPELEIVPLPIPRAGAVMYGRAFIDGDRYVEVDGAGEGAEGFSLIQGKLGEEHGASPAVGTQGCGSMKLGGQGKQLVTACVRAADDVIVARIRRSEDSGATFGDTLSLETLDTDSIDVAVSVNGSILMTGVCRPAESSNNPCRPGPPLLLKPEGKRLSASLVEALNLDGSAVLPAFSPDGRSAYFLGRRSKDDRTALFVSHDGGESFSLRPLDTRSGRARPSTGAEEEDEDRPERGRDRDNDEEFDDMDGGYEMNDESTLTVGEDGVLGLMLLGARGPVYLTADDDGRVLSEARPPAEDAVMGGFGRRVLAVSPSGRDDSQSLGGDSIRVWESMNGGASFDWVSGTRALDRDFFRQSPIIACGAGGCLLGDSVTRVGWQGQAEAQPEQLVSKEPKTTPSARTPIVCQLDPKDKWVRVENVFGSGVPDINEAMRGRSQWSVLTWDPKTGSVQTVSAELPPSGEGPAKVLKKTLFAKAGNPDAYALDLSLQMEGYAAARVRYPADANGEPKLGAPMRNIELAWENYFMDGGPFHASIADAGPIELGDIKTNRPLFFDTALISVSLQGLFVRPHSPSARTALTFFVEPGGKQQRFGYPAFPARAFGRPLSYREDTALAQGQMLAVGMEPRNENPFTTVLLGHNNGDSWTIRATRVAPNPWDVPELIAHTDWSYAHKAIGVTELFTDHEGTQAFASFQAFQADASLSEPEALPTPFDLPVTPRPCKPADRNGSARLEAPLVLRGQAVFGGTRHPVLISEAPDANDKNKSTAAQAAAPMVLLTRGAVVQGSKDNPCISAWDATPLGGDRLDTTAILPGDLSQAWLIRLSSDDTEKSSPGNASKSSGGTGSTKNSSESKANLLLSKRLELLSHIEYRPMRCQFDPSVAPPSSIWNASGMSRKSY